MVRFTFSSVITDYSLKIKFTLADFEITPDIAILECAYYGKLVTF